MKPYIAEIITRFTKFTIYFIFAIEMCTHLLSMSESYQPYTFVECINLNNNIQSLKCVFHLAHLFQTQTQTQLKLFTAVEKLITCMEIV